MALIAAVRRTAPAAVVLWSQLPATADVALVDALPETRPRARTFVAGPGWVDVDLPARVQRLTIARAGRRRPGHGRAVTPRGEPGARDAAFGATPDHIPRAVREPEERWLVAVALGGQGHYAAAATELARLAADPAVPPRLAAHAAVTRAAHLRQLGGHAAARTHDAAACASPRPPGPALRRPLGGVSPAGRRRGG